MLRATLSESEKAMLFDMALAADPRDSGRADIGAAAPLIEAFARAYVAIRDREDGVI
jgi:hypothetical protein